MPITQAETIGFDEFDYNVSRKKLIPKIVRGGVLLVTTDYVLRKWINMSEDEKRIVKIETEINVCNKKITSLNQDLRKLNRKVSNMFSYLQTLILKGGEWYVWKR